ncbi:MAG: shikimate kinase [Bacillota bacterium]|nr:shikimate kinase [Bacillota bacterium]
MGSGKTTTGKALAEISGFSFVDTDALIEESEKASIPEIFSERGEEYFRKAESEAIFSLSRAKNTVIAVGGGAVLRRRNVESLKKHSVLVFLDAPPEKILLNLASDQGRPLINGKSDEEIIRLYENRRPVYLETADIVLDASGMDTDEIVSKILAKL